MEPDPVTGPPEEFGTPPSWSNTPVPPPSPPVGQAPVGHAPYAPNVTSGASPSDIRPKKRWYVVAGAVLAVGLIAALALGFIGYFGLTGDIRDFERVSGGTDTVVLDAGEYVVYSESVFRSPSTTITDPDGEPVRTQPYLAGLTYNFGGRSGFATSTFRAEQPGSYVVTTDGDVAIGPSIASDLVRTLVLPLAIGVPSSLIALVIFVVTAVRRSRSKRRLGLP